MPKSKTPSDTPTMADALQYIKKRFDELEERINASADEPIPLSKLPFPASTARRYIREGLLKAYYTGKRVFVYRSDLNAFMQSRPRKGRPKGARNKVSPIAVEAGNRLISGAV